MHAAILSCLLILVTSPAIAGDAAKGAELFNNCKACHRLQNGSAYVVRGGTVAPNLFGVIGRKAGSDPGYTYSPALKAMAARGAVWSEADLARYVANPNVFVSTYLGDENASSKMPFQLSEGAGDIAAYLAEVAKR